jgi:hypothetical protein
MIQKLTYLDSKRNTEEIDKVNKLYGLKDYHHIPANFQERDEEWFATKCMFRTYSSIYTWWDNVPIPDKEYTVGMHFFGFHDGSGVAIYCDYWVKKTRYFSFAGCIHEMRNPTKEECDSHHDHPGRCYHVSICDKCGYWHSVDSSD